MKKDIYFLKLRIMTVAAKLQQVISPLETWLIALLLLMCLDVLTGITKARFGKSEKSEKGYLNSSVMWQGGVKKILTLVVLSVAIIINQLLTPDSNLVSTLSFSYYIATEALSVLENVSVCGLTLPPKLVDMLETMKENSPPVTLLH